MFPVHVYSDSVYCLSYLSVYSRFNFFAGTTDIKETETVINYKSVTDKSNNIPLHNYSTNYFPIGHERKC
jgi:hypothetical protein